MFGPDSQPRTMNLPKLFGQFLALLVFQERFAMTEDQWRRLVAWGWFPFTALNEEDQRTLGVAAHFDDYPAPQMEAICRRVSQDFRGRLEVWRLVPLLKEHMEFFNRALDRYEDQDYLSCLSLLLPRIEGVMRTHYHQRNPGPRPGQQRLMTNLVGTREPFSALLPNRFEQYLHQVYFRDFDLAEGDVPLSRHAHGHGVSRSADYDFIRATVAFLTLDQCYYYLCH